MRFRRRVEIVFAAAAVPAGALAAFVLENFLEIALLFLRIFLRARSRVHSAVTTDLGKIISTRRLIVAVGLCVIAGCSQRIDVLAPESSTSPQAMRPTAPSMPRRDAGSIPDPDDPVWWTDAATTTTSCGTCGQGTLCAVDTCIDATGIMSIDAWLSHTCEVDRGQLYCWGSGELGQLGAADRSSRNARTRIGSYNDWLMVTTGEANTCALRAPGRVYCFGDNRSGELAQADTSARLEPTEVLTAGPFRTLSCGGTSCCALDEGAALWCWGDNLEGKLGQGDPFGSPDSLVPIAVMTGTRWLAVEVGQGQACAIRDDRALLCWGRNPMGEAGLGSDLGQVRAPLIVGTDSDWISIAASQHHSCGVRDNGSLWCWGSNPFYEVSPTDTTKFYVTPTRVGAASDWEAVGTGWFHTCASKRDGRLFCWGRAIEGQLGQGGGDPVAEPTLVTMPKHWQRFALGSFHTCGVDDSGALYCWGMGDNGQLGIGDNQRRYAPERVP